MASKSKMVYALFYALIVVVGLLNYLYILRGLSNFNATEMLTGFLFETAKKVTSGIFEGMISLI